MAAAVAALSGRTYAADTLLGVGAHSALAFGVIAVALLGGPRIDLMAWLFGDLLAVGRADLAVIWGGAAAVLALLAWRWSALLTATLNPDLAQAGGIRPRREQMVLTLTLAITVAVAIKVVGALLIAAMLIIPAAAARPFARSPEAMAALAAGVGARLGAGRARPAPGTGTRRPGRRSSPPRRWSSPPRTWPAPAAARLSGNEPRRAAFRRRVRLRAVSAVARPAARGGTPREHRRKDADDLDRPEARRGLLRHGDQHVLPRRGRGRGPLF